MPIYITGMKELRAELKALDKKLPRELNRANREGAKVITARAVELAPQGKTGELKASGRPFSTAKGAGVRFTVPYAGVQEFAVDYFRRAKGTSPDHAPLTKAAKKHFRQSSGGAGVNEVHYTKNGAPPRFAYRAVGELAEGLMESTFERIVNILRCNGWFK